MAKSKAEDVLRAVGVRRRLPRLGGLALVYAIIVGIVTVGAVLGVLRLARFYPVVGGYVTEDFALPVGAVVLLVASVVGISDLVYRADRDLALAVYSRLSTWLDSREAALVTRRLFLALENDDFGVAEGLAGLYAERVLLPRIRDSLRDEIIREIIENGISVEPVPQVVFSKGVYTHETKAVARCPEHGPLKPAETFRENGHLYCIYCGREVK